MKLTASVAALLLASTAMAQTATPAAPATPDTAAPAPATPPPAAAAPAPAPAAAPAPAPAPAPAAAPAAPAFKFALHGFVSMSSAYQTGLFNSEGQLSNYSTTPATTLKDPSSLSFDVRHSRFNFSVQGPQVLGGATPSGILEIDFMGGFGAGANGSASLVNRLRIAVAELSWLNGAHRLQFGQQNDLIFAMAPTSLSHIGQPLGYATGNSGWRRPGVFGFHTLPVAPDTKVELAWEVARGNWNDAASATGGGAVASPPNGIMAAEASTSPALEGRATLNFGKVLTAWVGGHHHQVDLTGVGANASIATGGTGAANVHTIAVESYNAGAKAVFELKPVTVTLAGTGFSGKNAAPLITNFGSYRIGSEAKPDVSSMGYWAQAGVGYDKFSLWGFYGEQKVDEKDFARTNPVAAGTAAYQNATTNVMAMYRDGGFGFSLEWINFATKYAKAGGVDVANEKVTSSYTAKSDQYMFTANYFF